MKERGYADTISPVMGHKVFPSCKKSNRDTCLMDILYLIWIGSLRKNCF